MGQIAWYKRDPVAARDGMRVLSLEEKGAYNVVLDLIYEHANKLYDDDRFIAAVCQCDLRVWKRIKARLFELGKLRSEDGYLRNRTADGVVAECLARVVASRNAAITKHAKSGRTVKKNNNLGDATACADALPTKIESKRRKNLNTDSEIPGESLSAEADGADRPVKFDRWERLGRKGASRNYPTEFEHFWKIFPKRATDTPKKAYTAWVKAANDPNVGPRVLYVAARRYAKHIVCSGQEPQMVSTWINAEGWTSQVASNEYAAIRKGNGGKSNGRDHIFDVAARILDRAGQGDHEASDPALVVDQAHWGSGEREGGDLIPLVLPPPPASDPEGEGDDELFGQKRGVVAGYR